MLQNGGAEVILNAPLETVRDYLAKQLKPDRKLLDVVVFQDGSIAEASMLPPRDGTVDVAKPPVEEPKPAATPKPAPVAGATVAQPTQGCPAPDFDHAVVRATQVLRTFLNPQQIEDFERYNRFISVGADTGHRYMLTSRSERDELRNFSGRSLFDLDENRAYCVHDWTIPAPEELLTLHLFLSIPGKESFLRSIPEGSE